VITQGTPWRIPGQDGAGHSAHHNEIQAFIERGALASYDGHADVAIVEIGGTVGDIESLLSLRLCANGLAQRPS